MEGGSTKIRFVRCPGCLKLLVEYANIPVYPCGGCNAVLRAKNHTAAGENANSRSLEENHSLGLSDIGSSDYGSTSSVKQMIACSTSAHSELEHEEKETKLPNIYLPYSGAEYGHGETSGENGIEENGSDTNQLAVGSEASRGQADEGIHSKAEVEDSLKLSQQPFGGSKVMVMSRVEGPPESASHSVASEEEDMVERGSGDGVNLGIWSPATRSSHAYDGSISSSSDGYNNRSRDRYLRLSRRTYRQPKALDTADIKGKEGERVSGSNQMTADAEADLQARTISSKPSNESHGSPPIVRSFGARGDEFSSKHGMHELERQSSFGSEDFHSVRNWMEPENDGPYRSPSRGSDFQHDFFSGKSSKYVGYDGMDLLRKMDELKDQLRGLCKQRVGGEKPCFGGIDGQQPLYRKSERQPPLYFDSNLLHHPPEAIYGPGKVTSGLYQFSQWPFSGRCCCSCSRLRLEGRQLQLKPKHRIDGIRRALACDLRSHSSTAGSSGTRDQEQGKSRYNEKRKPKMNHCRPICGGAPFMVCYSCFELLQLPADFLISRRRPSRLQCSACSEVLELSFPAMACISPRTPSQAVHPCNEAGNCADVAGGSVSHSNDFPRGDPVSFSEAYGLSYSKSFSTEAEPVLHGLRNSSEGENHHRRSGSPLHRLMGYSSASELLYRCCDIDEDYESIESMVPHCYRPSQESRVLDGLRQQRMSTSCHEQTGPCADPDCMEIHEEEGSPRPLRARRRSLLHDGPVKRGVHGS